MGVPLGGALTNEPKGGGRRYNKKEKKRATREREAPCGALYVDREKKEKARGCEKIERKKGHPPTGVYTHTT